MSYEKFEAYYKSKPLEYISVSFFYAGADEIVGFCAAAFYTTAINGKPATIARSATGFMQQYQGNSLSKWALYSKYMIYKLHHPFRKLILTIYASNPFIYSMVCKYTGIVYPRLHQPIPNQILTIKNEVLAGGKLQKRELAPFVVKINFEVEKAEQLKTKARESNNVHVQFFVAQTGLRHRVTLLLIIPVSFINITWCCGLMTKYAIVKRIGLGKRTLLMVLVKVTYLPHLLVAYFTAGKARYANRKGM